MDHCEHFDRETVNIFLRSLLNLSVKNNELKIRGLDKLETRDIEFLRKRGFALNEGADLPAYNVTTPTVKNIVIQHRYQYTDVDNLQSINLYAGNNEEKTTKLFSLRDLITGVQKFIKQWTDLYQGNEIIPRRAYIQSDITLQRDGVLTCNVVISNVYGLADLDQL